jgi:hypothetical protein
MGIVIAIVVAVIIVAAAAAWLMMQAKRRRLRQRFGPEYERLTRAHDSRRKAEAELAQRERRVADLDIHPLSPDARSNYRAQWTVIQEQFVETPAEALTAATRLVAAVMRDRGYPATDYDQILADLSVDHAHTLSRFRAGHEISTRADAGGASTEDMRQAMIDYRSLFQELAGGQGEPAAAEAARVEGARVEGARVEGGGTEAAGTEAARAEATGAEATGAEAGAYGAAGVSGTGPEDVWVAGDKTSGTRSPAATAVDDPARQAEPQQRSPRR